MKLICGLGNPGLKYKNTRHNIGFLALDNFAKINKTRINKSKNGSLFGKLFIDDKEIMLIKPQLFMNDSGQAVRRALSETGTGPGDILVICDDINLPLGKIRLRQSGSAGGHKGLVSIIKEVGTKDFNRLRVGIGYGRSDKSGLTDYVLSEFKRNEKKILKEVIEITAEAVRIWVTEGIETAMNRFNAMEVI